jgi:hypothetical protein
LLVATSGEHAPATNENTSSIVATKRNTTRRLSQLTLTDGPREDMALGHCGVMPMFADQRPDALCKVKLRETAEQDARTQPKAHSPPRCREPARPGPEVRFLRTQRAVIDRR